MALNERLKKVLEDRETNQTDLARAIGVNRKQIGRWIRGEQEMGINKFKEICIYFQISADYFLDIPDVFNYPREEFSDEPNDQT